MEHLFYLQKKEGKNNEKSKETQNKVIFDNAIEYGYSCNNRPWLITCT
jgi:hypothetical protein